MTFKALALAGLTLSATAVSAVVLEESKVLSIPISQEGLTRISVKGDKIVHLFSSPVEAGDHVAHHDSGHVFISPSGFERPISLSLVTGDGHTQDLTLTPKSGLTPKPLILEKAVPKKSSQAKTSNLQAQAGEVLKVFVAGGIAPGFNEIPAFEGEKRPLLEMTFGEIRRFENSQIRVSLFEGRNRTEGSQEVQALALTRGQDLALYVLNGAVAPEGKGRVFVVQKKEN